MSRIVELSKIIATNTLIVDEYFDEHQLLKPSFAIDNGSSASPFVVPPTAGPAYVAHTAVVEATQELHDLMIGPVSMLRNINAYDLLSLQGVYRFKVAQAIPVNEERTFPELAEATGVDVVDLRRLVRHAMTNHIFHEPRPDVVAHTAASRLLAENKLVQDVTGMKCEEFFKATAHTVDAVEQAKGQHDYRLTGFSLGHRTNLGFYEFMEANPVRGQRVAGAMDARAASASPEGLFAAIDWTAMPAGSIMVDVGGAHGPVAISIATRFPNMTCIVQDLPQVVKEGPTKVPPTVADRVRFEEYNFMTTPQPVTGADIYFFRAVFHNWPDKSCVTILRNQIAALRKGSRILIQDKIMPEPGTMSATMERDLRLRDLIMLTAFGSSERTRADWENLLKMADSRFVLKNVSKSPAESTHVMEIVWAG